MSLKLRDFAKTDIKSEKVSTHDDIGEESDDDISYLPPSSGALLRGNDRAANYEEVPRNIKDEKPLFGPPGLNGNIQVTYPSMIDGYAVDGNSLQTMESLGLPTGFSLRMDGTEKQKKGEKKTFYCQICLIELNSLDTMRSHVKGVKHMKKELQLNAQKEEKIRKGEISRREAERGPKVIPIPNPASTKMKVPVRLHEKIKETRDPVVGLDFIREYIAVSDPEMEPHYECDLCGNQGIANGMFSHLMGHKHRQRFVEEIYKEDPSRVMDLSQGDLLKYARIHNENGDDLGKRIRCRRSDEEYPWPPGKAPWASERGGTGIPPDGARENWGKNKHYGQKDDVKPVVVGRVFADNKQKRGGLPSVESLKAPKNEEEAIKLIQLGEKMLSLGFEFSGSRLNHNEKSVLGTCLSAIMSKILAKRGMQPVNTNGHHSPPRGRRQSENTRVQKRPRERNSRSPSPHQVKRERRSPSSMGESRPYREMERSNSRSHRESQSNGNRGHAGYDNRGYSGQDNGGHSAHDDRGNGGHDDRGHSGHDDRGNGHDDRVSYEYSEKKERSRFPGSSSHERDHAGQYGRDNY